MKQAPALHSQSARGHQCHICFLRLLSHPPTSFFQALGALLSGVAVYQLRKGPLGLSDVHAYRLVFVAYGVVSGFMALCYTGLTPAAEAKPKPGPATAAAGKSLCMSPGVEPHPPHPPTFRTPLRCTLYLPSLLSTSPATTVSPWLLYRGRWCTGPSPWWSALMPKLHLGLRRPESRYIVAQLSAMFAMDAFAGAFVMQVCRCVFGVSRVSCLINKPVGIMRLLFAMLVIGGWGGVWCASVSPWSWSVCPGPVSQTWIALWFTKRWGFSADLVGYLLMGSNCVAGASGIAASYFVKR
jgi:hypothetical protein